MMNGATSGRQRTRDSVRRIEISSTLKCGDRGVIAWRAMLKNSGSMRAGDIVHAPVLERGFLQRHPKTHLLQSSVATMSFVLVPRGWGAVVSRFHDGMLKMRHRFVAKQLFCNSKGIGSELRVTEFWGKVPRIENLWQHGRFSFVVVAEQVVLEALRESNPLSKEALKEHI